MITNNFSPLVTILIDNYNYADFLAEAIDSALNQTYQNFEVIVVDDGSTDGSRQIIEGYGERIIPIFKTNGGQASAFNQGFAVSQGKIICLLDADDVFAPTKVEKIVNIFQDYPDIGWCFHPLELFSGEPILPSSDEKESDLSGVYDVRNFLKKGKLRGKLPASTATSGMCFDRSLLEKLLPMPEVDGVLLNDDYLKYAAFGLSPGYILTQKITLQRIHENNLCTLRKNAQHLRGKITMLTAFWLKNNFPQITQFANNIFAIGYTLYNPQKYSDTKFQIVIEKYLSSLNISERVEIEFRRIYYRLTSLLGSSF